MDLSVPNSSGCATANTLNADNPKRAVRVRSPVIGDLTFAPSRARLRCLTKVRCFTRVGLGTGLDSTTRLNFIASPPLFLLDARGVHRVAPLRRFAADQGCKLGRRVGVCINADFVQPL